MTRDDPILGTVRMCKGCGEEWPLDDEFWHLKEGELNHNYPHRCRACCVDYYAARRRLALQEKRAMWRDAERPIEGKCNKPMNPVGFCGRKAGHNPKWKCRSQWAMRSDSNRHKRAA